MPLCAVASGCTNSHGPVPVEGSKVRFFYFYLCAHTCGTRDLHAAHATSRGDPADPRSGTLAVARPRDPEALEPHEPTSQPTAYNLELSSSRKRGGRFSRKARLPSAASSLR
jgi:hypothetical protein